MTLSFGTLQVEFREEFIMYNLAAAALAAALPLLQALFHGWQALAEPTRGLAQLRRWRPLLESSAARDAIFQVWLRAPPPLMCPIFLDNHALCATVTQ